MNFLKSIQYKTIGFILIMLSAFSVAASQNSAMDNNSDIQEFLTPAEIARSIAQKIDTESLFITDKNKLSVKPKTLGKGKQKFLDYREQLSAAFFAINEFDFNKVSDEYLQAAIISQNPREINAAKFFAMLQPYSGKAVTSKTIENLTDIIEPYTQDPDWLIAATAWHLLSTANNYNGNLNSALQNASTALSLIPNELSPEVSEMRVKLMETLAFLYARLRNPELATVNTKRLIELQQSLNLPVDGAMHLNNLIYVFAHWRDHETAQYLAEILLKNESSTVSGLPGLTQMRIAQTKNEQFKFEEGLKHALEGLTVVTNPSVELGLEITRIVALAGIGKTETAQAQLKEFENKIANKDTISDAMRGSVIHAKALIAFNKGDTLTGQKLMTQRMDQYIQSTLRTNNNSASKLIATLENSKTRQIERQSALQREADLREAELKQKTVTNSLLIVLSMLMGIAAILSALFARYRSKSAAFLRVARDQAKAGEKAKSEFLAIMSHELRTPLNGIIGIADLLATTAPTDDLRHKNSIILQSGNDLLSLVEDILDMSRIEAGELDVEFEPIKLRELIHNIDQFWRPLIEKKDIAFTTFVDDSVPDIFNSDPQRMRQCINNLVSNAAKFTQTGRIHVHATSTPAEKHGEMVLTLIVADTGSGIREEVIERLFQPFVQADASITRQYGGSGLGLAITRSLARILGGDVSVVSRADRGSEFTLTFQGRYAQFETHKQIGSLEKEGAQIHTYLEPDFQSSQKTTTRTAAPIIEAPDKDPHDIDDNMVSLTPIIPEAREANLTGLFNGLRVLIVEDVVSNQDIIQLFLRPMGCKFVSSNNGTEALRALEIYEFDIILMDIRMPEMDGIEATKRIRTRKNRYCDIPIIALTADKTEETQSACREAGIDLFLTKPIISKDLIAAIRFIIEHPPQRGVPYMSERQNMP